MTVADRTLVLSKLSHARTRVVWQVQDVSNRKLPPNTLSTPQCSAEQECKLTH